MKRIVLLVATMMATLPAWGGQFNVADHTVYSVGTGWGAEGLFVRTNGSLPAGANCGDGNVFLMEPTNPMQREITALLISALQSRSNVHIYVDGCVGGAMKLKAVAVNQS